MRIFLIGLPLAVACLTGFTTACAGPHPAGSASAAAAAAAASPSASAVSASAVSASAASASASAVSAAAAASASTSASAVSASAGSASAEGILTGHLYAVGGPAPGMPRPWPGTVTLSGPGVHRAISVGAGGGYSVLVPAGSYAVAGRSPLYQDGAGACRAAGPVTVASGHRTRPMSCAS